MLEIVRHLLRRKVRTSLTILAIGVGVFAITSVGSIAERLENLVIQPSLESARGRILVWPENWRRPLTEATLRRLRRVEGVAGVTVTIADRIAEDDASFFRPRYFSGTRSDIPGLEYEPPRGVGLWAGRVPEPGSRVETVVSWDVAQDHDLEVGDEFLIRDHPFRVVGIWEHVEWEEQPKAFISYEAARRLATSPSFPGVGEVGVIPEAGVDPEALAERVREEVGGVEVWSPQDVIGQTREALVIFTLIVGASGVMALLIGTFTIVNTMVVSVHERAREIGLKKALGAGDSHALAEFVAEAACIGGAGGMLGMLAGGIVGLIANEVLFREIGVRPFLLTPRLAVGAVAFAVLIGTIAGIYPAWRAARLDPVVALRGGGGAAYASRGLRRLIYLIRRNARSILTVGGIAIGIFALVVLGGLAEYLNRYVDSVVEGARHKVYVRPGSSDVPFGRSTARTVRNIPGVRAVVLTRWGGFLDEENGGLLEEGRYSFYGIDSPTGEFGWEMPVEVVFAQGRNLHPGSPNEVVVGAGLAEEQNLRLGSTLTIRDRDFVVVGIRERAPQDFGEMNYTVHISMDALARLLGESNPVSRMTALVSPGYDPQEVARTVEAELPGIETVTAAEQAGDIRSVLAILFAVMGGLFSIAVFVGGVSVVNTMVIAVHERTREIGLKKALGAADTNILAEVLADAAKLGALGGILGVLASWPVVALINLVARGTGGFAILDLTPRLAVGAVVFSTLLGMVAGLLPAWRAARLDPVVALRTE